MLYSNPWRNCKGCEPFNEQMNKVSTILYLFTGPKECSGCAARDFCGEKFDGVMITEYQFFHNFDAMSFDTKEQ